LRELQTEFDRLDTQIVIVTFEANYLARQYIKETGIEWPLLIDKDRHVYHAYGMMQARFWDIWGPSTWLAYLKEIAKGEKLKMSGGDIQQRGGDVLISPEGIIKMHHVGTGPAGRPDGRAIIKTIKSKQLV
jgi:hypothetical protein